MSDAESISVVKMLDERSSDDAGGVLKPEVREAIHQWQEKRRADVHQRVAARSAAASRKKYREERESEGKSVRRYKYHNHLPQQPDESLEVFRKRLHRDRQQSYRAPSNASSRPRADLSTMTQEERAEHTRMLATARKRRQRERAHSDVNGQVEAPSVPSGIKWGMF